MRKIIIISAVSVTLIGLLITLSPYLMRLTGLDGPVKDYLIKRVFDEQRNELNADKLYFGINNLDLEDVTFVTDDGDLDIHVERIRFHFNFWKLWTDPAHPQAALKNIYFLKPSIVLNDLKKTTGKTDINTEDPIPGDQLLEKINRIPSVGRIQIREGKVDWYDARSKRISIARGINGWVDTRDSTVVEVSASGKLFEADKDNVGILARVSIPERNLVTTVTLRDYSLSSTSMTGLIGTLPELTGKVDGSINIKNNQFVYDSTWIDGNLSVRDAGVETGHGFVSDINFDVRIIENRLEINNGSGLFAGEHPVELNMNIADLINPSLDAKLSAQNFPLSYINQYIGNIPFNGSTANVNMKVNFDGKGPRIEGQLFSRKVSVLSDPFSDCQLYFSWVPGEFAVDYFTANWHGLSVLGSADFDTDSRDLRVEMNGFQNLGEHVVFDHISGKIQKLNINLAYSGDEKNISGDWYYSLAESQDTVITIAGDIRGNADHFIAQSRNSSADEVAAILEIGNYLSRPVIKQASIYNLPVQLLTSAPVVNDLFSRINTEMSLSGSLNDLRGEIDISSRNGKRNLFSLNTELKNLLHSNREIRGDIDLKNLTGDFEFIFNNQFFGGDFNLGEGIDGELYIDITKEEQLYGKIDFSEFRVIQALKDSISNNDFRNLGTLNGEVLISGSVYEPKVEGNLTAEKFVFNDMGYYQARLGFQADRSRFVTDTLGISLNNSPVMTGTINWTLLNNMIEAEIRGEEIDVTDILRTVDYNPELISGFGAYKLRIDGKASQPHIAADLNVREGTLQQIPFDELNVNLTNIIRPQGSIFNLDDHFISLENFYIAEQGRYHLHSIGKLPLKSSSEMDIVVSFDGDLFGLIPYWHSFFKDGASLVDLTMNIRGTTDNMHIEKAQATIERGELWLGKVAPHIEDIRGNIILKPGTNQIDFIDFQASTGTQTVFLNTVRDIVTSDGRKLDHWFFDELNLDFGILAIETESRGIELNIPGLMEENETGQFELSGKQDDEKFYFAGPVRHPLAYGKLVAYDSRVTFPFIGDDNPDQKRSVVVEFLRDIEWDVSVIPGEDIQYFRAIPAYIDEVQAEIFVDESSPGLTFTGILNSGTFNTVGKLESTRGRLEYLDQNFRVDHFNLEFTEGELFPDVSGKAWTTIRDSVGAIPKTIYLQLYVTDPETGQELSRGNWENFKFKLISADPQIGETQEQVLAYMGYSVDNIREKATSVGGAMTEKYLIRPLLRPIERALERNLGMDLVRFNSSIAKNLFYGSIGFQGSYANTSEPLNPFSTGAPYLFLMQSSEVTVGKYLTQDIYLTYTGQLVSVYDRVETGFDFNHSFGLEYRFLRNILVEFEYDRELMGYYRVLNERQYMEDFKIRLRHSFSF